MRGASITGARSILQGGTMSEISRRNFLKGAAVAGAAVAGSAALAGCSSGGSAASGDWMPKSWDYETDVVVAVSYTHLVDQRGKVPPCASSRGT